MCADADDVKSNTNSNNQSNLPMIKDELYEIIIVMALVSPIDGVYTISAVPTIKPPPTHVATGWINTQETC